MTALERPIGLPAVQLPPRSATHGGRTEVLVVGGGPAGFGAAMGAAAAGAEVVLVERYGFLGGNATAALVMPLMSFHNEIKQAVGGDDNRLLPTDHGEGEPVVAGVLWTLLDRLVRSGGATPPDPSTGYTVPFDPELFKLVTYDMLSGCGVRLLLHAFASDLMPLPEGGSRCVFETKSGPVVLDADVVVDCTGDGDLAAAAGAPYEVGRPGDGLTQPITLMFRVGNVDRQGFLDYVHDHPDQWKGVHGLWDLIRQARDAGELDLPREDILFFATPHHDEVSVNSTRIGGLGISVWDLTRAELATHRQLEQISRFLHDRVPGFAESYVIQSGVQVGVRETRRVLGDYQLTGEDVLSARSFDDVIARGAYPVDIHNPNGPGTILRRLPQGSSYDIPLRTLLPRDVDGLLVAGRCISGDHVAHSSYRIMPISVATGQAAGVCAALAARIGKAPREVPAAHVQRVLRAQGASLPT
ncbi:FAD-dependent oxidoreductase [Dactylosporangium darangshiense]|uniref:FAD-dependent oxidoreductase n=1 Tax=Dactylosporangium darangshiense TaxID=579108 RepID=A0ABP8DAR4_9ACTN